MISFYMPTKVFCGRLTDYADEFAGYGKRGFIVTGRSSAKNGSLEDCANILNRLGVEHVVFNGIEENPSLENVAQAAKAGAGCDFVIGLGGGSPLDAAKAVSILLANPEMPPEDLYRLDGQKYFPVLAIPTTAGTGSETTPFSVLTNHQRKTKASIKQRLFPEKAFLDARYLISLPDSVTLSTAVDVFAHLAEGYLCKSTGYFSDRLIEAGLASFAECVNYLCTSTYNHQVREKLLLTSSLAGVVISQTKTSLPHFLGYPLTYYKNIPHGFACGLLFYPFMKFHRDKARVYKILKLLGLDSLEQFKELMRNLVPVKANLTNDEIMQFAADAVKDPTRLSTHPTAVELEDVINIYKGVE